MTAAYRITKSRYAAEGKAAFNGAGGMRTDGRWNSRGRPIAYASSTLALAAMECLIGVTRENAPVGLVSVKVEVPDGVKIERWGRADLPEDWNRMPWMPETQDLGDRWLKSKTAVGVFVPSAVIPVEFNLLINPLHPDFESLRFGAPEPFSFDERLFRHPLP